ncbi:tripartite tricarboxylate transporter TctB family protein [Mycobacterium deserti]|uniref:Tripartite tricarboxylate transporter TctB family protein n=1 Tax=Mycobacterium deserti TaxID=2978347 RepID=A0ABT2M8G5_9MYCO|nr:tripartite tricarboxylate transporter TctB family protein [Mycobacterium deserti]MCT7658544.1 tripartite tricarboxylate transporter TctB family protein [Mycobacterium deserti]
MADTETASGEAVQRRSIPWGEWAISASLLAIGVLVLLDGLNQEESRSASGVGAGFMPKVVGVVLIALSVALIAQVARNRLGRPDEAEGDVDVRSTRWVPVALCVAAALVFVVGVETLGYVIVSSVAFWLTAWAVGARSVWRTAVIGAALALVVYLSFTRLLDIALPAGILGF